MPLLLCAALGNGCATSTLWENGYFAEFNEPAQPTHLRLFQSSQSNDVLVCYQEYQEKKERVRPRAYFLQANLKRVESRRKPRFVRPERAVGLAPIPTGSPSESAATENELYAVMDEKEHGFKLCSGRRDVGSYMLPVYRDGSGRVKQVLLTPLTVAADATIIGGYLIYYYGHPLVSAARVLAE